MVGCFAMKLWVAGLSLLTVISECLACSCEGEMTFADQYCSADFVLRVSIESRLVNEDVDINTNNAFYRVQVLQTYKKPKNSPVQSDDVFTAGNDGLCGITSLRPGEYIISGSVYDGKMRLSLCSSLYVPVREGSILAKELTDVLTHPPSCIDLTQPFISQTSTTDWFSDVDDY